MNLTQFVMLTMLVSSAGLAQERIIQIDQPAPDFVLPYATRDSVARTPISLSSLFGRNHVIVAFYPADWSPGCTREVCSFRDNFSSLQSLEAEILAISGDYVWSHHEWAKHHDLPFRLLSDHDHTVAKTYESYNESTGFNRRTVYLPDRNGIVRYRNLKYSIADAKDFEELKRELMNLR